MLRTRNRGQSGPTQEGERYFKSNVHLLVGYVRSTRPNIYERLQTSADMASTTVATEKLSRRWWYLQGIGHRDCRRDSLERSTL